MLKDLVVSPPRVTSSVHFLHCANLVSSATMKNSHTGDHQAGWSFLRFLFVMNLTKKLKQARVRNHWSVSNLVMMVANHTMEMMPMAKVYHTTVKSCVALTYNKT